MTTRPPVSRDPHRYDDLLELPHPQSRRHPRMDALARAAQFSPFAALTGFDDMIDETNASEFDDSEYYFADEELTIDESKKH